MHDGVMTYFCNQVSLISTMVGPCITASASEAAVTAICYENLCPREIFDGVDIVGDEKESSPQNEEGERLCILARHFFSTGP